jgi:8-oxo-dGTP pyrophosphatase MutT (NUDIX family)
VADLRQRLTTELATWPRVTLERGDRRAAAVAIALVHDADGAASFLLTRRGSTLRAHAGQWALPGGRIDEGETATQAACRELHEELGIDVDPADALGFLDDYATRSGFLITPVVVWAGAVAGAIRPSAAEVGEVYVVPLTDLDVEPNFLQIPESDAPVIQLPLLGHRIHAPTGAVLYQFAELALKGRCTRVSHFEQPVFAWR